MAEEKDIKIKIILNDGGTSATLKNINNQIISSKVPIKELRKELGNFVVTSKKLESSVNINRKQFNSLGRSVGGFTSQTGAATSATLEFGRVLSDAPYGIRGVANNVQQLASNLFFMSKNVDEATGKTIGFGGALSNFGKSLLGPAGILVAFQGLTALIDWYSSRTDKATESTDKMNKSIGGQATKLIALRESLEQNTMSRDDANEAIKAANKEFPELNLSLDENNQLTEASVLVLNKKTEALIKLAKAQALQALLEEKYSELLPLQAKQSELDTKAKEDNAKAIKAISASYKEHGTALAEASAKSSQAAADSNREAVKMIKKDIDELLKLGGDDGIIDEMFNGKKGRKGKTKKRPKAVAFDTSQISKDARKYVKEVMKMEKKNALLLAENNVSKLIIERDFQLKRLSMLKGDNSALIAEYEKYYDTLIKTAEEKLIGESKIDPKKPRTKGDQGETFKEKLLAGLEAYIEVQSSLTSFMGGEFDRQLTIEQNKTNALNNELNQRLLNENLSKDERERIQLQIARNDEKLRKKQEVIEKKRFKLNKAANIANATINTYLAANQIMSDPSFVGRPVARFVAMAATITTGLLNVAAIARQKFQSSAGSGGAIGAAAGRSGGEGEGREFNFNLAGSTQSNQLTQSIAGQLSQPIQAYVVSSEITSQQQLDLSISNTATIG
jgi:hypothetical protein